ncbi:MAG: translation elongation factor Ts [Alphaproteobacteria bacterium]
MTITANQVKELRERSGAGIMDCKEALAAESGNLDAALDYLRKKGLNQAAKKSSRETLEGAIAIAIGNGEGAIIELACETDFVARTQKFQEIARNLAKVALNSKAQNAKELEQQSIGNQTIDKYIAATVGELGENLKLIRASHIHAPNGQIASYIHNKYSDGVGKIGVLIALQAEDSEPVSQFARGLAMHVAASAPLALAQENLDPNTITRERKIQQEIANAQGKNPEITAKIIEGKMKRFFAESSLLLQPWVINSEQNVQNALRDVEKQTNQQIKILNFTRFAIGETTNTPSP